MKKVPFPIGEGIKGWGLEPSIATDNITQST
jgi:hypothetical protein